MMMIFRRNWLAPQLIVLTCYALARSPPLIYGRMPPSPLYYTMSYYSLLFFTPPTLCAAIHHYSSNTLVHITHCISLG